MWKKMNKPDIVFSIVWMGFSIFFFIMTYLSCRVINIELPRYVCPDTAGTSGIFGELNIGVEMKKIEQSHNTTVGKLEQSIRSEAITMTGINLASAILCLAGLTAQIWSAAIRNE